MKIEQLYKATQAFDDIVRAYIKRELMNEDTFGSWNTDEGIYFERQLGTDPLFVSWDSLELWAEKYFADAS